MKSVKKSAQHFLANVVCAFIYNDLCRKKVRAVINSPYLEWRRFVRIDSGMPRARIRLSTGFSGRNLIFMVGNKYVYKFIHKQGIRGIEQREYDIATALADASPVPLAVPTLLKTPHGLVRRYDFADGVTLRTLAEKYPELYDKNKEYLAREIANFMYEIAQQNPATIEKHKIGYAPKGTKLSAPGYMYGWYHGDIGDNFMIDPTTCRVTCIIDLESMAYGDFSQNWTWEKSPLISDFIQCVKTQYDQIWKKNHKNK